jgi:regulator of replication initiation timing
MTTARERYEAKTKVVTFRVHQKLYNNLKKVKNEIGLSFTDLVKLGAGIARDEIEAKIAEINDLQGKLEKLREEVQTGRQEIADTVAKERQEQLERLEKEITAFRLFDSGWSIEEVGFKLRMSHDEVLQHFKEWGEIRGEGGKVQAELLKRCLQKHIARLQEHILWRATKDGLEETKRELEHCRRMLIDMSKLSEEERAFLIAEYSYLV